MDLGKMSEAFESVTAIFELQQVIEVTSGDDAYRIDIYCDHMNPRVPFVAYVHMEDDGCWRRLSLEEFPGVDGRTGEAALRSALDFIEQRTEGKS